MFFTTALPSFPSLMTHTVTASTTETATETATVTHIVEETVKSAFSSVLDITMAEVPPTCTATAASMLATTNNDMFNTTLSNFTQPIQTASQIVIQSAENTFGVDLTSLALGTGLGVAGLALAQRLYNRYRPAEEPANNAGSHKKTKSNLRFLSFISRKMSREYREKSQELAQAQDHVARLEKTIAKGKAPARNLVLLKDATATATPYSQASVSTPGESSSRKDPSPLSSFRKKNRKLHLLMAAGEITPTQSKLRLQAFLRGEDEKDDDEDSAEVTATQSNKGKSKGKRSVEETKTPYQGPEYDTLSPTPEYLISTPEAQLMEPSKAPSSTLRDQSPAPIPAPNFRRTARVPTLSPVQEELEVSPSIERNFPAKRARTNGPSAPSASRRTRRSSAAPTATPRRSSRRPGGSVVYNVNERSRSSVRSQSPSTSRTPSRSTGERR